MNFEKYPVIVSLLGRDEMFLPWARRPDGKEFIFLGISPKTLENQCLEAFLSLETMPVHPTAAMENVKSLAVLNTVLVFAMPTSEEELRECLRLVRTTTSPYFIHLPQGIVNDFSDIQGWPNDSHILTFGGHEPDKGSSSITGPHQVLCGNGLNPLIRKSYEFHEDGTKEYGLPRWFFYAVAEKYPEVK